MHQFLYYQKQKYEIKFPLIYTSKDKKSKTCQARQSTNQKSRIKFQDLKYI